MYLWTLKSSLFDPFVINCIHMLLFATFHLCNLFSSVSKHSRTENDPARLSVSNTLRSVCLLNCTVKAACKTVLVIKVYIDRRQKTAPSLG